MAATTFDDRAAGWDSPPRVALARALFAALGQRFPLAPGLRVLDYGAGTGLASLAFASAGCAVTAADTSRGMLDELVTKLAAGTKLLPVNLFHLDAPDGNLPAGPFDLIHLAMTLHHVAAAGGLLARLTGLLAPGGHIALFDLEPEDGLFHADRAGVFHDGFAPETLVAWFDAAGCENITVERVHTMERTLADGTPRTFGIFGAFARRPA